MLKAIIFDLDGTLYKNPAIAENFANAAYHALAKFKNIKAEEARRRIEEKRAEMQNEYGSPVPYTLTLQTFGLPIERWHEENVAYFDPRDYLEKDERLKKSLGELKKNYRLAILTNNNRTQTDRILEALDLENMFEKIFTYNSFRLLKPDPRFFQKATEDMRIAPEECCFVGDRYNVDLHPAQSIGMQIYQVKGPEDIYYLSDSLLEHMCPEKEDER